jgi:hypothetical protein
MSFPGPGRVTQISTNGGNGPRWRADGREIFYLAPDNRLMAVSINVQLDGGLEPGTPAPLFTIPSGASFDITGDGQRVLVSQPVGDTSTPPITLILNWHPDPGN